MSIISTALSMKLTHYNHYNHLGTLSKITNINISSFFDSLRQGQEAATNPQIETCMVDIFEMRYCNICVRFTQTST